MKAIITGIIILFICSPCFAQEKAVNLINYKHKFKNQKIISKKIPGGREVFPIYAAVKKVKGYLTERPSYKHPHSSNLLTKPQVRVTPIETRSQGFFSKRNYKHHFTKKYQKKIYNFR